MADRRLQVFYTVARLLSFTKAAESLHMTQPAVTFQIRQLEEHFNTRLFDRAHNRISLTEAGESVYRYAERIISMYNEMENEVRKLTGDIMGLLVIGASTTIAEYVLPALLGEFQERYPQVKLRVNVSNSVGVVQMVENNEVDVGIVESPVGNKNLMVKVCWHDKLVLVCPPSHALANRKVIGVKELKDYPFLCREEGSGTREVISNYLDHNQISLNDLDLAMEFGSPESVKSAVEAGLGVSILSEATLAKELKLKTLAAIQLDPPLERPFSLVYQKQKFRVRAMEEFLAFAQEHCEKQKTGKEA
jgi:DNA-binding transcriptional LysR family regulator